MRFLWRLGIGVGLLLLGAAPGRAQTIALSSSPGTLRISTAQAGVGLTAAVDETTSYSVSVPGGALIAQKITAALDQSLPGGLSLRVTLQPPGGATGMGAVSLSTSAQDVVRNIGPGTSASGLGIRYELSATLAAGAVAATSRTITFTILNGV